MATIRKRIAGGSPLGEISIREAGVVFLLGLAVVMLGAWRANAADSGLSPGILLRFSQSISGEDASDVVSRPNLLWHVPRHQAPTPFLAPGAFTIQAEGFISVDLRGEYSFEAELTGELELTINGAAVLTKSAQQTDQKPIRLRKGTNVFVAVYRSPAGGDAFCRVRWKPKGSSFNSPIPDNALSFSPTADWERSTRLREGRELFFEMRCAKCHLPKDPGQNRDLAMDAPSFEGIGSRRHEPWMAQWILNPQKLRSTARMPRLLHGEQAPQDAAAVAAFLASLQSLPASALESPKGSADAGRSLFETLLCSRCHLGPDEEEDASGKISLARVAEKFSSGALEQFLKKPQEHFAWIRMPDFHLTMEESKNLSAYLLQNTAPSAVSSTTTPSLIQKGREVVQTSGCLKCHSLKLEDKSPVVAETFKKPDTGCLRAEPTQIKAPYYELTDTERTNLTEFLQRGTKSSRQHSPAEEASRWTRLLQCAQCHGQAEGFPALGLLGGKLKPEWTEAFLAGKVPYKPRPWLPARMPSFPAYAQTLAHGLAHLHGYPSAAEPEGPVDPAAAQLGQKLVSAMGGFSCIACHAVGGFAATAVFESAGINLIHSEERLLKPYFHRWLRNPLAVDPNTKMPVYFDDEGKSPITDVLDGDAEKQIEAMRQYIRLGEKMPPPPH